MEVRPFRFVGASDRVAIEAVIDGRLAEWAGDWFSRPPEIRLTCDSDVAGEEGREWLSFGELPDRWIAFRHDQSASKSLLRQLFPALSNGTPASGLGDAVVRECLADLAERCLAAAGMPTTASREGELPRAALEAGRGSQFAHFGGDALELTLVIGGAVAEALAAPCRAPVAAASLQPRQSAIGAARIGLEVVLGDVELSLGDLLGIAPGDVISLDALSRDPLKVRTDAGQPAFHAHLGRNTERKVIQVSGK